MFRHYRPDLGRYLTPDPIGLAGGMNLYGYVVQNPPNKTPTHARRTGAKLRRLLGT
jgi:RHS repeat-associated protein